MARRLSLQVGGVLRARHPHLRGLDWSEALIRQNRYEGMGISSGQHKTRRSAVVAWIIYDVGNTLFFTGIVGLFFPLWVTQKMSGDDATVGYTLAAAMALNLVVAPIVGAFSDQTGRRMPILAIGTFTGIVAVLLLGGDNLALALSLFALAVIAINTAAISYNAMLADVSTEANRGTIGGLGVGIGYLGAIMAVAIGLIFVETRGYEFGFRAVGLVILVISVPLLMLLKERPRPALALTMSEKARMTLVQLRTTLSTIQRYPGLLRFLIGRFWYTWSLYTASTFAILYGTGTVGFDERQVQLVLLVGILVAIPSGLLWGVIVDRVGPNRALSSILLGWTALLMVAVGIPWLGLPSALWWGVGVGSGVLIAGIWAADRPYLIGLTSQRYLGEFFGLHSMSGRLSSVLGPFTWGFITVTLGLGQTAAVLSLAACGAIAFLLIRGGSDRSALAPEDRATARSDRPPH